MALTNAQKLNTKITAIADAVREKSGATGRLTLSQMPEWIRGIQTGGNSEYGFGGTGVNWVYYGEFYSEIGDTSYSSSNTYGSATTILPAETMTIDIEEAVDTEHRTIVYQYRVMCDIGYDGTESYKSVMHRSESIGYIYIGLGYKKENGETSYTGSYVATPMAAYSYWYNDSTGKQIKIASPTKVNYGVYPGSATATTGGSRDARTITVMIPEINIRNNSTYMSSANITKINSLTISRQYSVYTCDEGSTPYGSLMVDAFDFAQWG